MYICVCVCVCVCLYVFIVPSMCLRGLQTPVLATKVHVLGRTVARPVGVW